jgi:dienelactone hydrolase
MASAPPLEWGRIAWVGLGAVIVVGFVGELLRLLFVSPPPANLPAPLARQQAPVGQPPAAAPLAAAPPAAGPPVVAAPSAVPQGANVETAKIPGQDPPSGQSSPALPATALPRETPLATIPPATIPPATAPSIAGAPVSGLPVPGKPVAGKPVAGSAVNPRPAGNRVRGKAGEIRPDEVAGVPLPVFPDLGPGRPVGARGVTLQTLSFSPPPGAPDTPGGRMKVRVYLPPGQPRPQSVPCILVAPAGTPLVYGMAIEPGDSHNETLPYAEAGMVVVMYELDGGVGDAEKAGLDKLSKGYKAFRAAAAGVVNGRNALDFALAKIAIVDPRQIYAAGHSSGGTATLLFAEHETRLKGAIGYAPCTDISAQLAPFLGNAAIAAVVPGLAEFAEWSSPDQDAGLLKGRVMLFNARDDTVCPFAPLFAFVQRARRHNPDIVLKVVEKGGHYDSMIQRGIPAAIGWIKGEPPVYPATPVPAALAESAPAESAPEVQIDAAEATGGAKRRLRRRRTVEINRPAGQTPTTRTPTGKSPAAKGPAAREPIVVETGPAIGWTKQLADIKQIPDEKVTGMIDGIDFTLDQATLAHGKLTLTKGPKFHGVFAEAEVVIHLTIDRDQDVSGQRAIVNGRIRGFGQTIYMSAMRREDRLPKGQFVNECVMFLEFGSYDAKARTQPGRIYLCLPDRGKSYLAGTFEARVE